MRALTLSLLLLLAGCVAPEAIEQARHQAAISHGHALDVTLPLEARQIAADDDRAWQQHHKTLTGDPVPGSEKWPPLPRDLDAVHSPAPAPETPEAPR